MSKIGIGVTTYNRPEHLNLWTRQMEKYCMNKYEPPIFCVTAFDKDTDRRGIAYQKNACLRELKKRDVDYIFLFDDDCFVIKPHWAEFFINAHLASGQHHFLYLKETLTIKKIGQNMSIDIFNNCGGCFMFLTKEVIEKVGGYCKDYGRYGYEHAGFTSRIHAAGLTPMGKYLCPQNAGKYIYAMDYDNYLPFNKEVNHQPSIMNEINMLPSWLAENKKVYERDIQTIYQSL